MEERSKDAEVDIWSAELLPRESGVYVPDDVVVNRVDEIKHSNSEDGFRCWERGREEGRSFVVVVGGHSGEGRGYVDRSARMKRTEGRRRSENLEGATGREKARDERRLGSRTRKENPCHAQKTERQFPDTRKPQMTSRVCL